MNPYEEALLALGPEADEAAQRLVDSAPELNAHQRSRLAGLLRSDAVDQRSDAA